MERNTQEELKAHLMATDEHFRELVAKHSEYHHALDSLEAKAHLSDEEQLEEVRLKKLKLHLKDEITEMLSRHLQEQVA